MTGTTTGASFATSHPGDGLPPKMPTAAPDFKAVAARFWVSIAADPEMGIPPIASTPLDPITRARLSLAMMWTGRGVTLIKAGTARIPS
jgi:hypothetical protein